MRLLQNVGTSLVAFGLMVVGALLGNGLVGKVAGAALGGFVGGLLVALFEVPAKSRFTIAAGWAAFAAVAGLIGFAVFEVVPDASPVSVFLLVAVVGGLAGGVISALIQGPVLWTVPRTRVQWSVVESLAFTAASLAFLLAIRLERPILALPLAAVVFGALKQLQPGVRT